MTRLPYSNLKWREKCFAFFTSVAVSLRKLLSQWSRAERIKRLIIDTWIRNVAKLKVLTRNKFVNKIHMWIIEILIDCRNDFIFVYNKLYHAINSKPIKRKTVQSQIRQSFHGREISNELKQLQCKIYSEQKLSYIKRWQFANENWNRNKILIRSIHSLTTFINRECWVKNFSYCLWIHHVACIL